MALRGVWILLSAELEQKCIGRNDIVALKRLQTAPLRFVLTDARLQTSATGFFGQGAHWFIIQSDLNATKPPCPHT